MTSIDRARAIRRFEQIPRLALGHYPTPVEPMLRLREALGPEAPELYIKHDDYSGPGFGGNKVRKLEYLLAAAREQGADTLITCGAPGSNHCRVTAMLAARLGLDCVLVLNRSAATQPSKPANLALDELCGARIVWVERRAERALAMEEIATQLRSQGRRPSVIALGASTPLGAMGYVAAAGELAAQCRALGLSFDAIFFCSSSGGTQAGLVAGKQLFLEDGIELYGVSPDDSEAQIAAGVKALLRGMGQMLETELDAPVCVLDGYVGAGYGIETPEARQALELLARTEGVILDPVYTAKAMAGLLDWVRSGRLKKTMNVLFWHTGGQLALFAGAASS